MVKVVVADDSKVTRRILRDLLESGPRIKIVGEASKGIEIIDLVMRFKPDVVIMNVVMPGMNSISANKEIRGSAHANNSI